VIRAIDLCCGGGGWALAARGLPIEWVAVADLAEDCLETWRVNHAAAHPSCQRLRVDLSSPEGIEAVREVCLNPLGGGIDLIVGGIPCEQVSAARRNRPAAKQVMADWHRLIDSILSLVRDLDPRFWSIEDVIGIERHLPSELELGMAIPKRRVQASTYGPQRRVRTFLGRFPRPAEPEPGPRVLRDILRPGPYLTVGGMEDLTHCSRQYYGSGKVRIWDPDKPGHTVLDWGSRHCRAAFISLPDGRIRRLGFEEAAALQGFPEDYLFAAGISRSWKMCAQAIPIYVGRAILRAIVAKAEAVPAPAGRTPRRKAKKGARL
jgi:site-specific DNA-cytosine methylase